MVVGEPTMATAKKTRGRYVRGEKDSKPVWRREQPPQDREFQLISGYCYHLVRGLLHRVKESNLEAKWRFTKEVGWVHEFRYGEIPLRSHISYADTIPVGRIDLSPNEEAALRALGLPPTAAVPITVAERHHMERHVAVRLDDYFNVRNYEALIKHRALMAKQTGT